MSVSFTRTTSNRTSLATAHRAMTFGRFVLDLDRAELFEGENTVKLRRQSFDVLCYLVERHGRLVEKHELLCAVWGDAEVTEDSLTHCIIDARKALGDVDRKIIRTVPRRGFVFDLPVEFVVVGTSPQQTISAPRSQWHRAAFAAPVAIILISALDFGPHENTDAGVVDPSQYTEPIDARVHYEQGRFLFNRRSPGDLLASREHFHQAIELDPNSANAWAGLSGTFSIEWTQEGPTDDALLLQWKTTAEKALELDPNHVEGLLRLSGYYAVTGDNETAELLFGQAESLDPYDPLLLGTQAGHHARNGNLDRAIELQRLAVYQDPLSFTQRGNLSYYLFAAGYYEEALSENRQAYQVRPSDREPNSLQGYALILLQRYDEALRLAESWHANPDKNAVIAMASLRLGRLETAAESIRMLETSTELLSSLRRAEVFAFCEHFEHSFNILSEFRDQYVTEGATDVEKLKLQTDTDFSPFFNSMRSDQRWQDWLADEPVILMSLNAQ